MLSTSFDSHVSAPPSTTAPSPCSIQHYHGKAASELPVKVEDWNCGSREDFVDDMPVHVREPPVAAKARKSSADALGVAVDVVVFRRGGHGGSSLEWLGASHACGLRHNLLQHARAITMSLGVHANAMQHREPGIAQRRVF